MGEPPVTRKCSDCPNPIGPRNTSGHCRRCSALRNFQTPDARQKVVDGVRRHLSDPDVRRKHGQRSQEHLRAWRATPEGGAAMRAQARINLQATQTAEGRAKRVRSILATIYAGIPEHRWDECRALRRKFGAAEAKRMIVEDEVKRERERIAAMTPFERQLERVKNGAQLVAAPDLRPAPHNFTLGGVASGMI
jgi:hypothetical protein